MGRKILHVVRQYAPAIGGLEIYVQNMVRHQKALGHDCEVLTLNKIFHGDGSELPAQNVVDGVPVRRVGFWGKRRFFIPKVAPSYFKKFDVVHVHNTDVFYDYVALVSLFFGVKAFATTHGGFFHTDDFSLIKKIYFNVITRFSSLWYKTIFAISGHDYKAFHGLNRNVILQPNAVESLGDDIARGRDFIYIGRLAEHKHVERAIEVFSQLRHRHGVQGKFHVVGPEWDVSIESLRTYALQFGVSDDVVFHGAASRSDIRAIIPVTGYFLSGSSYEGFGMSMIETMSAGLIPFVQDNESFRELITESGIGACMDYTDAAGSADTIATRLPEITREDRIRAQTFARKFSWDELVAQTERVYGGQGA